MVHNRDAGKKIILVEGNICAGKSTLSQAMADKLGLKLFLEPVKHNPFLELYYGEPKKYALVMQIWLLKQRYETYVNAIKFVMCNPDVRGVVLDRSIYSDGTFAEQNFVDGNFTAAAYDYYKALKQQMMENLPRPSLVVYLDVSAEKCHERIHGLRQRDCESGIPLAYLQGLEQCHHNMIKEMSQEGIKVLNLVWKEFGTSNSIDEISQEIENSPPVPQSEELKAFVLDNALVAKQAVFKEHTQSGQDNDSKNPSLLLAEHEAVEVLMVETIDPSTLTEGEVTHQENPDAAVELPKIVEVAQTEAPTNDSPPTTPVRKSTSEIAIPPDAATTPERVEKSEAAASSPVSVGALVF